MKLGVIKRDGEPIVALECDGHWIDFTRAFRLYELAEHQRLGMPIHDVLDLLAGGLINGGGVAKLVDSLRKHALLEKYRLEPPFEFLLPFRPGKIIAVGRNYAAHAAETGHDVPKEPIFFAKSPSACIGPEDPIVVRASYGRVDPEAELGVVIGRTCKNLAPEQVFDAIAAYTLVNDVTARDMQRSDIEAGHPWFRSKSLDTFCPLGPYLVLRDAIAWPVQVDIECRVNGEVRQHSNTSRFIFPLPELIAYITRYITLEPGDVISTGTPEGIAPIYSGDIVEVRVPEIGILRNSVVSGN